MRRMRSLLVMPMVMLVTAGAAHATDIPILGRKLIVVDRTNSGGTAKVVFLAKDQAITKGSGTDPAQIEATLDVAYDAVHGTFDMPQGGNWIANSASVSKYVNRTAPVGGAVKVGLLKSGSLVKVVGKSLGDASLDISTAPSGAIYVVDTVVNSGETTRLCTQFTGCVHKTIAGGALYKLSCKGNSTGDPGCAAATTTTTSTTIPPCGTCIDDMFARMSGPEAITVPFIAPETITAGSYSGLVEVDISGQGQGAGGLVFNDAFYYGYESGPPIVGIEGGFTIISFAPTFCSGGCCPPPGTQYAADLMHFIEGMGPVSPGAVPPYAADHHYRFVVDLGSYVGPLTLANADCGLGDNTGSYSVTLYRVVPQ